MLVGRLQKRGVDAWGSGAYGAPRGGRKHKGIDYACPVGMEVCAPVDGQVTKLGYPYGDDLSYRYVEIETGQGLRHRIFYLKPRVVLRDYVVGGRTVIGEAQDISARYPPDERHPGEMVNHVHYEVLREDGTDVNPEEV